MNQIKYQTIIEFLKAGLEREITPLFYFDTNVILDIIDQRHQSSIDIYNLLINKNWELVTSIFAKVEIYETKQKDEFRKQKTEQGWIDEKIKKNMEKRDLSMIDLDSVSKQIEKKLMPIISHFNKFTYLIEDGWILAEEIKASTNLTDKDSVHLAEARAIGCDVFLSKDEFLIEIAQDYIWTLTPESMMSIVENIGLKNADKRNRRI